MSIEQQLFFYFCKLFVSIAHFPPLKHTIAYCFRGALCIGRLLNSLPCLMKLIHINLLLNTVFFETNTTFFRLSDLLFIITFMSTAHSFPKSG